MPTRDEHLRQAERNEQFLNSINSSLFPEWRVVIMFYISLHYVDAFLAQRAIHPRTHGDRLIQVRSTLRTVFFDYRRLLGRSEDARYNAVLFTEPEAQQLFDDEFTRVRSYLRARLGLPE